MKRVLFTLCVFLSCCTICPARNGVKFSADASMGTVACEDRALGSNSLGFSVLASAGLKNNEGYRAALKSGYEFYISGMHIIPVMLEFKKTFGDDALRPFAAVDCGYLFTLGDCYGAKGFMEHPYPAYSATLGMEIGKLFFSATARTATNVQSERTKFGEIFPDRGVFLSVGFTF